MRKKNENFKKEVNRIKKTVKLCHFWMEKKHIIKKRFSFVYFD
jgi:hypothetical protein